MLLLPLSRPLQLLPWLLLLLLLPSEDLLLAAMVAAQSPRRTREGRWPGSYPGPRSQRSSDASRRTP